MTFPDVEKTGAMWTGVVAKVGPSGNLVTNFRSEEVKALSDKAKVWMEMPGHPESIRGLIKSSAEATPGRPAAVEGADGFIEIALRDGDAAQALNLKRGDKIKLHFRL